ncbi:MAG: mannose-6-phosphate isomerase, class I [bacterium]|nr:mannose-6-phosphate isomerase, class I [bacterium]
MYRIIGAERHYEWGSPHAIPTLLGTEPTGEPLAELWFGAHPTAPAVLELDGGATTTVAEFLEADPTAVLGEDVVARFGGKLPFLLKLIAPARALSLQVHPDLERAAARFAEEEEQGIPLDSPLRNYQDANHKPEMLYALTRFEAMAGFRAPRRAAELLGDLGTDVSNSLHRRLRAQPDANGVADAFSSLLLERPSPEQVEELAAACAARLAAGSSSPRVDRIVIRLQEQYPGDPGVVAPLLLNPVTLQPGEALFIPAGSVHAYLSGLGVEVMASSDNVLRAGLTTKHIDVPEMLACVDYVAAPPIRIAPERISPATEVFYAPVDDFELGITRLTPALGETLIPGRSARVILCVEGAVTLRSGGREARLTPGQAVFLRADDAPPTACGHGTLAQADLP